MASLTEHVMINKLGDDLDDAITFVGGDTSNVGHIMQYPQIIREQLSANNIHGDELILEDDTCIIIATDDGRDEYNTRYASGVKSGLIPNSYYLRICTAVQDIEPIYVDLSPIMDQISSEDDIQTIFNKLETIENRIEILEQSEKDDINEIASKVTDIVKDDVTIEVTKTIEQTFVSDVELQGMMFSEEDLEKILTI